jgi:hypothetical protein
MRLTLAFASMLTDARCHNEKARNLTAWQRQVRAMVSLPNKATGVSALTPAPVITPTHPGKRTQLKLAKPLSLRRPARSIGADNERSPI